MGVTVKHGYGVRFSPFTGLYNRKGFIAVTCKLNSI
nr:MAG TPA: response regulator [Caudoviricetes sp.]